MKIDIDDKGTNKSRAQELATVLLPFASAPAIRNPVQKKNLPVNASINPVDKTTLQRLSKTFNEYILLFHLPYSNKLLVYLRKLRATSNHIKKRNELS